METIDTQALQEIKVGDYVRRMLAGVIPMDLKVTETDDKIIYCGKESGWWFDRATGMEIDDDLGWGPKYGITGSYIIGKSPKDEE